jgi:photosystem II stability/assembly factor-like uncharacterized protein
MAQQAGTAPGLEKTQIRLLKFCHAEEIMRNHSLVKKFAALASSGDPRARSWFGCVALLLSVSALTVFFGNRSAYSQTHQAASSLNGTSWTPLGPGPAVQGFTDFQDPVSGRIAAVAAHPTDPSVLYIAAAGGGVWKSTDAGSSWTPLTDTQSTLFMGAIALAPSSPEIIYAGAGEAHMGPSKARNFRDNIYYGRGVLKSTDGGASWTLLGAAEFDRVTISKIVVEPSDPNTVYVAVGALATNGVRGNTGIWKSIDGGATWSNTTANISALAAFSDLVMDPANPQVLYAAVGEPGVTDARAANSVYKTTNGGATWARAGNFPLGTTNSQLGRIALAISPAAPQTVYASIARPGPPNSMTNSLYRIMKTTNAGATWSTLPDPGQICFEDGFHNYLAGAGDYHQTLAVDPANANIIYAGGLCLIRSTDGGSTWLAIAQGDTRGPHRDHQGAGFDAAGKFLDANDGGIWRLDDPDALAWSNRNGNLQITQFVGMALHPTNANIAYGGTQDEGTVRFEGSAFGP